MARNDENTAFVCLRCGQHVMPLKNGSYRNHCPGCLWSLHVDLDRPGDRMSRCRGLMEPIELVRRKKGLQLIHRCTKCGRTQANKVALHTDQDDLEAVLRLMASATS